MEPCLVESPKRLVCRIYLVEILKSGLFYHANRLLIDLLQTNPKNSGRLDTFKPHVKDSEVRHDTTCISRCSLDLGNGGGEPRPTVRAPYVAACEDGTNT